MTYSVESLHRASSVGLIGSCVARDLMQALFPGVPSRKFLWRIGTLSLMSSASSALDIRLPGVPNSALMTLDRDINKTFDLPAVLESQFVVIDFLRDMYASLALRDGRMITNGIELMEYKPASLGLDVVDRIHSFEPRYLDMWLESFRRFCDIANQSPAQFIIVPIYQLTTFFDGAHAHVEPGWDLPQILSRNLLLGFLQRIALSLLHNAVLAPLLPETLALDPGHEYGRGPYHFRKSAFERAADLMATSREFTQTISASASRREDLVAAELKAWSHALKDDPILVGQMAYALMSSKPKAHRRPGGHALTEQQIELVLPLKPNNEDRGSDILRARHGLIKSLDRLAEPSFISRLSIVVPSDNLAAVQDLLPCSSLKVDVISEDQLIPPGLVGDIPRRGWYLQQLIKLAYSKICATDFYVTLDADVFLINPLNSNVVKQGCAPVTFEPTSAHTGWWEASAKILGFPASAIAFDHTRAFGVTPAFLKTSIVTETLACLEQLGQAEGKDWITFLAGQTCNSDATWTEYSLYWTYLINNHKPESIYYPHPVYIYTHYPYHIERLVMPPEAHYKQLFAILPSSLVSAGAFAALADKVLSKHNTYTHMQEDCSCL